jgi:hypothetical protein
MSTQDDSTLENERPSGFFMEVPAHLGITPNERALRTLLEAPADLPLTQWYISLSTQEGRRLAGCCWKIVGTLVPATPPQPGYPFCQYSLPQPTRLQAWLWRVFTPPPPPHPQPLPPEWMRPFGDLRWHPQRGTWIVIELLPSDGPDVTQRVWGWVHASRLYTRGRPLNSGYYSSTDAFLGAVLPAIRHVRAQHAYPSQASVMAQMGWAGDTSRLREQLRKYGYTWSDLLQRA